MQSAFLKYAQASSMNQLPKEAYDTFLHVTKCTPVLKTNDDGSLRQLPAPHQDKAKLRLAGAQNKLKLIFERAQTLSNKGGRRDIYKSQNQFGTSPSGAEIAGGIVSMFHVQLEKDFTEQFRNKLQAEQDEQRNPNQRANPGNHAQVDHVEQNQVAQMCSQIQETFPNILGNDPVFEELKQALNACILASTRGPDQSVNMIALQSLMSALPEFLRSRNIHIDDLNALGVLNLDIENAHTSYRLKEAFESACRAEPALSRFFYQATAMQAK